MAQQGLIEEYDDSILFHLPAYRNNFLIIFLPLWLCGWAFGWGIAIISLFRGTVFAVNPNVSPIVLALFLLTWWVAWTCAGVYLAYQWGRMAFGMDLIEFEADTLEIREIVLRWERRKIYTQADIWNFRVLEKANYSIFNAQRRTLGEGQQTLAFDYGNRTIQFGKGISESSALKILELVQEKFPQYKPRDAANRYQWQPPRA